LIRQLAANLESPLTLICAPAGYGRTTLLSEWFASEKGSLYSRAWFSLDEEDNDLARFLTYLIAVLPQPDEIDGETLLALLNTPQPGPPKVVLTGLIRRLGAFPRRIALILDDCHFIKAPPLLPMLPDTVPFTKVRNQIIVARFEAGKSQADLARITYQHVHQPVLRQTPLKISWLM